MMAGESDARSLVNKYLVEARVAQIASVSPEGPWLCTVYIATDSVQNIYWLSYPGRRHSRDLENDSRSALAITIKTGQPVIGIQAEGRVEIVEDIQTVELVMKDYMRRHDGTGKDFYKNFIKGTNRHQLYRFNTKQFSLFDEVNFPDDAPVIVSRSA